jgi:hypothetical protein
MASSGPTLVWFIASQDSLYIIFVLLIGISITSYLIVASNCGIFTSSTVTLGGCQLGRYMHQIQNLVFLNFASAAWGNLKCCAFQN